MSTELDITFRDGNDIERVDLTRIGIVAGGTDTTIRIEPDIDGWDGVRPEVACEILRSVFAACGVWVDIRERTKE